MNIIQTWKTKNVPAYYHGYINKITNLHPQWNYMFFDDNAIVDFMKSKMPEYINVFNNLPYTIQKIDFFRYLAIYYYGGVYLDLDMDISHNFDNLMNSTVCSFPIEIKNVSDHVLKLQNNDILIGNYAFYSPPRHPFLKNIIDNIVSPVISDKDINIAQSQHTDSSKDVFVYHTTGPILVSYTYNTFTNKDIINLIGPVPFKKDQFGIYGEHCSHGTWKT